MKKLILFFALSPLFCYSQENKLQEDGASTSSIKNRTSEFKIGVLKGLIGPILDIEYEKTLNEYSSFGGNVIFNSEGFALSPFYRFYFTETKEYGTKGFFAQPFLGYYTGRNNSFGIGFGVGKKWINKKGFVFQLLLGGGRIISGNNSDYSEGILQGDVYIGYRF